MVDKVLVTTRGIGVELGCSVTVTLTVEYDCFGFVEFLKFFYIFKNYLRKPQEV
jgi:hypothetical protein